MLSRRKPDAEPTREWRVVLTTDNLTEAHIVAGRLQNEGIPAWVHQQPGASAFGITVGILGEVNVVVDAKDYDHALAVLEVEMLLELEDDYDSVQYIFPDDTDTDDARRK
jgi:hypothetical protein